MTVKGRKGGARPVNLGKEVAKRQKATKGHGMTLAEVIAEIGKEEGMALGYMAIKRIALLAQTSGSEQIQLSAAALIKEWVYGKTPTPVLVSDLTDANTQQLAAALAAIQGTEG